METTPSVLYDAVVVPSGKKAVDALAADGRTREFLKDQYRHCKSMLVFGDGVDVLAASGIPTTLPTGKLDPGVLHVMRGAKGGTEAFVSAIAKHRHYERETDPPRV